MHLEELSEYKNLLEQYLSVTPARLSAYSFINLASWTDFFHFTFREVDHNLLVFAEDQAGMFLYLMPLGNEISRGAVEFAFNAMKVRNGKSRLSRIENVDQSALQFFQENGFNVQPKGQEYCYNRNDIASLKGNAYKSQRSGFNQFLKSYQCQFLPYQENHKQECLSLFREWRIRKEQSSSDEMFRFMLEDNEKVHARIFNHYERLGLTGRVVAVNGKIKGYTFGYPIGSETFCVFLEITDPSIKGISSFIFSRFCQDFAVEPYTWINAMDDFGLDNVKKTKMSYRPVSLLPAFTIYEGEVCRNFL